MDALDISQLKPEDVRDRPTWDANPWLLVMGLVLIGAMETVVLLLPYGTSRGWAADVMGLLLGGFYGWRQWRRGEGNAWLL